MINHPVYHPDWITIAPYQEHPVEDSAINSDPVPLDILALPSNETIFQQLFTMLTGLDINQTILDKNGLSPVLLLRTINGTTRRTKRLAKSMRTTNSHTPSERDCRIRTKTNDGYIIGDFLLLSAESFRNPLLKIVETVYEIHWPHKLGDPEPIIPKWLETLLEVANHIIDMIAGFFTMAGYSFAKYATIKTMRALGHSLNRDDLCLRAEFSLTELFGKNIEMKSLLPSLSSSKHNYHHHPFSQRSATSRQLKDSKSLAKQREMFRPHMSSKKPHPFRPAEFKNSRPFHSQGTFLQEALDKGIHTIKNVYVNYNGQILLLSILQHGRYYLMNSNETTTNQSQRVYFDEKSDTVHLDRRLPAGRGLNYFIVDGPQFIELYKTRHQVTYNPEISSYEILLHKNNVTSHVPVYWEPLSEAWHLSIYNHYPIFTDHQRKLINRIAIRRKSHAYMSRRNDAPFDCGNGQLWYEQQRGNPNSLHSYIEINGQLTPIRPRANAMAQSQCPYEIYSRRDKSRPGQPIEWDGRRWVLKSLSAPQVSEQLEQLITDDQLQHHLDQRYLSPPDEYGLRWDRRSNAFLKIRSNYIRVDRVNIDSKRATYNRFTIAATPYRARIHLRFRDNAFYIESAEERAQRPLAIAPLNHDHNSAIAKLKNQHGFSLEKAQQLFANYHFPETGFFSAMAFAIDIEQTGIIPSWADIFQKKIVPPDSEPITETVSVFNSSVPAHRAILHLGPSFANSSLGHLFFDHDDHRYLIKKYSHSAFSMPYSHRSPAITDYAEHEAQRFRHYYGEDSAWVFYSNRGQCYLRIYPVTGMVLANNAKHGHLLPPSSSQKLIDMVEKLALLGIPSGDLTAHDIVWNNYSQSFYPLDIHFITPIYYFSSQRQNFATKQLNDEQLLTLLSHIA